MDILFYLWLNYILYETFKYVNKIDILYYIYTYIGMIYFQHCIKNY